MMFSLNRLILFAALALGLASCGSEPITADEQARLE
jgi:hypothetical protein